MTLRIALTHAHCWPEVRRGGERYLHELAGALARRGNDVTILAGASRTSEAMEDGVRVVRLKRRPGRRVAHAERNFGRRVLPALVRERFDVVHALGPQDAVAAIRTARVRRHRTVYTCLGLPRRRSWERRLDGPAHGKVVERVDVYGCLSVFARELLRSDYGRDGALTPGGVRLDAFCPGPRTSEPTLLYSGALDERRKGLDVLLRAVPAILRAEPRVRVWLSGPGDPGPLLAALPADARDRVEVLGTGALDDLPRRYASAWATVLPAVDEAFGLVLVESLAAGTPIVVADHSSLPELVKPGIGATAAPNDPDALALACVEVLGLASDPATAERSREEARRHDWDTAVAPAIEALYRGTGRDDR